MDAIDRLPGSAAGSPESDELEILVALVEACEAEHWQPEAPDRISAIKYEMEARGLVRRELGNSIGSQPHASEVLNRHRPLTLSMIRALSLQWNLPADVHVREYDLASASTS